MEVDAPYPVEALYWLWTNKSKHNVGRTDWWGISLEKMADAEDESSRKKSKVILKSELDEESTSMKPIKVRGDIFFMYFVTLLLVQ